MFKKVLIANRGEIALRVIAACRELGVATVAVYSDADQGALHAALADEAYRIGPAPARESYLSHERILEVARRARVEAIHPGYGFLSESAAFARACEDQSFVFVGPPATAMEAMGHKTAARARMQAAGVPVVPGSASGDDAFLIEAAREVGFPLLVKASAGGGGKGMRVVRAPHELPEALEAARTEAARSFGDDTVYLERLLERPRHVEVQVLGLADGRVLHLFERECSVQRRHQKIIEESPSVAVSPDLRARMGAAAVRAAEAVGYRGAGTIEMLLEPTGEFYFLEMNTRLQVEHPVTEMVTGVDLVKAQLRIAAGEDVAIDEGRLAQRGHAIEARVYAEDPSHGFAPQAGAILFAEAPSLPHVRIDTGIATGSDVSVHYDPLLAKVIAWGETRLEAIRTLREALRRYAILGPTTNMEFLLAVLEHPAFVEGALHVGFVDEHLAGWQAAAEVPEDALVAAAIADHLGLGARGAGQGRGGHAGGAGGASGGDPYSPWRGGRA